LTSFDADVARGLEAERRDREREPEVVVDALRNLHDADRAVRRALDRRGTSDEVVAADVTSASMPSLRSAATVFSSDASSRVMSRARRAEYDAAVEVYARDFVNRHLVLLVGVALGEPLEAVVEADGRASRLNRLDDDRADDAVRPRRGPAADKNTDSLNRHDLYAGT
jgi:hypothetical protein